jgi:hypothetical protein
MAHGRDITPNELNNVNDFDTNPFNTDSVEPGVDSVIELLSQITNVP